MEIARALATAMALLTLFSWSHPQAFSLAALVLALADPAAALGGPRIGGAGWHIAGGDKTVAGSLVHFTVAFVLAAAFCIVWSDASPPELLLFAGACTLVEVSLGYGLDNLVLPPAAAVMAVQLLRL